jgi:hypothetical protein
LYANTSGGSETNATNIANNTTAITANTAKVGYTDALVSANTAVVANTAKGGITTAQSTAITANTAKVGYTEALVSANTDVVANTSKVGYTDALVSANTAVAANTLKVGYTEALVSANTDVVANTSKVGYTEALVSANTDVTANTAKVGYTEALVSANSDVVANTAKTVITTAQASEITTNNAKTGITTAQSNAITANTLKVGYTEALVSANTAVAANTLKVGYTEALVSANTDVAANIVKITNATHTGDVTGATVLTITNDAVTTNKILNGNVTNAKLDKANISLSGFDAAAEDVALGDNKLTGVADPTDAKDAATKAYVDALEALITDLAARITALEPPPVIGDAYQGGIIAYILQAGDPGYVSGETHGLIAAGNDQTDVGVGIVWITGGATQTTINGNTLAGLGTGQANTTAMMNQTDYTGGAAKLCDDYSITEGGVTYNDWFLPSQDELNLMYANRVAIGNFDLSGVSTPFTYFWSSTENSNSLAWVQHFVVGQQSSGIKNNTLSVRAVRAF